MTPLFPAQRAAEEFDQVLAGTATPAARDRFADLLDTVEVLRAVPQPTPRAEFVADLRTRLMTAAETDLVGAPANVRPLRPVQAPARHRRIGTIAASLVIVGGSAGMAAAASGSLPGEPLYPVKRGIEQVATAVHMDEAGKGQALLGQAATRLDEVHSLQSEGSADPDLVQATLASFRDAADAGSAKLFTAYRAGGDAQDVVRVRTFAAQQMDQIAAMSQHADPRTRAMLLDAADTLAEIDQQARVVCASCGPAAPLETPAALSAGAGAAAVDTLLARPVSQARKDIAAAEAARDARLREVANVAEQTAGQIPQVPVPGGTGTSADAPTVRSTITGDGQIVPALTSKGTAVNGLVTGVTSTVDSVTKKVTTSGTPIDGTLKGVDGTVKGVEGTVDGVTGGLLP